jgi:hypothetical protein
MPADASIFQQFLRPPKSVAEYGDEMDRAESNRLALAAQRLGMQETSAKMAAETARRNAIAEVYGRIPATADPLARARALQSNPYTAKEGQEAEKAFIEAEKGRSSLENDKADRASKQSELIDKKLTRARDLLGSLVNDPQAAQMWLRAQYDDPDLGPIMAKLAPFEQAVQQIPTDARQFAEWRAKSAMGIEKYSQALKTQTSNIGGATVTQTFNPFTQALQEVGRVANTQSPDNAASNARMAADAAASRNLQREGMNRADQRARDANAAALSKPFEVTGPEGTPILVQQAKDGSIRRVDGFSPKGGASNKPLTDAQSKALLFGARMKAAEQVLEANVAKGVDRPSRVKQYAEGLPFVGQSAAEAANLFVASPEQQQVEQAQRDFINAVLRRESGAVIADSEFDNARKQYFPQIGDSPAVKAQKKQNREIAQRGILAEVPDAARGKVDEVLGNGQRLPTTNPVAPVNMRGGAPKPLPKGTDLGGGFKLN